MSETTESIHGGNGQNLLSAARGAEPPAPPVKRGRGRPVGPSKTKRRKPSRNASGRDSHHAVYGFCRGDTFPVGIQITKGHGRIVDAEAVSVGVPRHILLALLLRRYCGLVLLERSLKTVYTCSADEMVERERFIWYVNLENRELLEKARMKVGHLSPSAFVIHLINQWIGTPNGPTVIE